MQDWYTGGLGGPVDVVGSSNQVIVNAEEGVVQVYNELEINPPTFESNPVFIPVQSFTHGGDEIEQYWFHPDHLGSSNYITNLAGEVSQHMEYFAFGETLVEEHRSSNNSPYKFNGKELDEETGWYYYGARYYDPRVSVWLSVDPLASYDPIQNSEHYIDGQHNGGVFNPMNLNVYGYCYQNPVLYIDPNGKQVKWDWSEVWGNIKSGIKEVYTDHYKYSKNGNTGMPFPSVNQIYLHKNTMKTGVNYDLPKNELYDTAINFAKGYIINKQKSIPTAKTTLPSSKNSILTLLNKATDIRMEVQILNAGQIETSNWYGSFDINVINRNIDNVNFEGFGDTRKSLFLTDESTLHYNIYSKLTGDLLIDFDYTKGADNINRVLGTDYMTEEDVNNFENLPTGN